ncbi:hypothetical protein HPB48_006475 [Haemaphysalis longicornis]|uniref:Uncharacterized protein n=1 Tax=Haemaphysalis longicornis TaxID=44386 RepID=A0A9J6FLR9_HAELO|nr:hypothetical protein HPB48_006475 [Haemaphysalis longicornis]
MYFDVKSEGSPYFYWHRRLHFYAAAYSCTSGLTNFNWFPYAIYRGGRGSFLVIYATVMIVLVVPMLHLETIVGQFTHSGSRGALECSPAFAGLSYTMAYFHVVTAATGALSLSHALIYLVNSGMQTLPWSTCGWPSELDNGSSSCYVLEA